MPRRVASVQYVLNKSLIQWGNEWVDNCHSILPCLSASSVCSLNPSLILGWKGFFAQEYLGETRVPLPPNPSLTSPIYKYGSLYHGRMWHDQASAYLYKDDFQPLASYPHSWDILGSSTEVFAVPEHALLSHASMLMYILFPRLGTLSMWRTPTHLAALSWRTALSPSPPSPWSLSGYHCPLPPSSPIFAPSRVPALLGQIS